MFVLPCSLTIPLVSPDQFTWEQIVSLESIDSIPQTLLALFRSQFPFPPFRVSHVPLNFLCEQGRGGVGGCETPDAKFLSSKVRWDEKVARDTWDLCSALGCCRVTTFHLENLGVCRDKRIIYAKITATTPPILPSARKRRSSIEFSAT